MKTSAGRKNVLKWATIVLAALTAFIAARSVVAEQQRDRTEETRSEGSVTVYK